MKISGSAHGRAVDDFIIDDFIKSLYGYLPHGLGSLETNDLASA